MNLSKSRYCQGLQCPKILWMHLHKSELRDDSALNEAVLETGNAVGDLAMAYFGDFTEVAYNADKSLMIRETKDLLARGVPVIAEGSFSFEGNFCSVDIIRSVKGGVEVTEVKSSTALKPVYLDDMAFQYYVLSGCGLKVKKISLMHINSGYERKGDLDIKKLFTLVDCTRDVCFMQKNIAGKIEALKSAAGAEAEPVMDIGPHCGDPYACGYQGYCWKHIPEHSVFAVRGLRENRKFELYHEGVITFADLLKKNTRLSEKQKRQIAAEAEKKPPKISYAAIKNFLDGLRFPLYFLDFETFQPAIPPFDGIRPYAQIPFQYSLHVLLAPKSPARNAGNLIHREFLAKEGKDPRLPLAERLCRDIPRGACILAYNMSFEKRIIAALARQFSAANPGMADHLMDIHDNIKDLMAPFQSHAYYRREFEGSYSIKAVLPALYSDDPELNYDNLELIHHGGDAMNAYPGLVNKPKEEAAAIRKALLAYCRLDTLAMVKIWEYLAAL
ncbi:MAG: DUF2779 domain-containing protein, partial [Treponema sp.]|nr:DUF2779 domain-containing protein [Treponema sp.]